LVETLADYPDLDLLLARAEIDSDAERALGAAQVLLAVDPLHRSALEAAARRLRQLERFEELADLMTYMVSLDHTDMDTVMRARQTIKETQQEQASGENGGESALWGKLAIAGAVVALILLILKGYF
jgi:hypothetical protein